jgi:signal transduction histidine kinase
LSAGLLSVLVIGGLVFAQAGLWLFEKGIAGYLEASLRSQTETLLLALNKGQTRLELNEERILPAYQRAFSGYYFQITLPDRQLRSRSLWDAQLPVLTAPGMTLASGPDGQQVMVLRADYRRLGVTTVITVAQDYTPIRDSFARLRHWGLAFGALLLAAVLGLQRLIVKRALQPLDVARAQLAQLQQGQRSQLQVVVPSELEPLVTQINHLQAHTEDSLKKARAALGNLGHALKTPLAVLLAQVNSARLDNAPAARTALLAQLHQMQARLEKELARARVAGDTLPGTPFDCASELPALFSIVRTVHGNHLELQWQAPEGLVLPWDREDMLELLGNVLDNACKWADSHVLLTLTGLDDGFELHVDDDGPGIPEHRREQVLSRGQRLDEQTPGHGLGLGIVSDIVEACHGRLALSQSALGGLRVAIWLPPRHLPSTLPAPGR